MTAPQTACGVAFEAAEGFRRSLLSPKPTRNDGDRRNGRGGGGQCRQKQNQIEKQKKEKQKNVELSER